MDPSQKSAYRAAKRKGHGSAGKLKPRNLVFKNHPKPCGKKHPKVRICVPQVVRPGKILPTKIHIEYAIVLNKNTTPMDGVEFSKLDDDECRNRIPFSQEWVRDNTNF